MGIGNLKKPKGTRVIGIDASTKSLAYAVIENGKPLECGEKFFKGADVFERLFHAKQITESLVKLGTLRADYVAIEAAVRVNSIQTYADLAYVYGAIIAELMASNPEVHKIYPISWQTGIGNPNLKTKEKADLKTANPGKSVSWYQNEGRKMRKGRTLVIAKHAGFLIPSDSDNIGDACGLALFASQTLTRP
jgi:Holliday junction resolvasome RuvABC endonuclease subunit